MALKIGLIGAGRMGAQFAEHLAHHVAGVHFTAVADANAQTSQAVASQFGVPAHYADYRDLLDRDDLDAVVITTPTHTHAQVIQDAAAAGKHIFCEKPLALRLEDCDQALAAVHSAGVTLQVGFMRRFDSGYLEARKQIRGGAIGKPVLFKSMGRDTGRTSLEFARRENSGGLIIDMGIHDFDLARWLMESEVTRVHSEGACLVYPELAEVGDIDNAVVNLKFESGALGNVDLTRNAVYGYDVRTEVLGSEGSLQIGQLRQTPVVRSTRTGVWHDAFPHFGERFAAAYVAEIRDFVNCVLENRQPVATGEDGRLATAIGIAATRSLDEARPVALSEISEPHWRNDDTDHSQLY